MAANQDAARSTVPIGDTDTLNAVHDTKTRRIRNRPEAPAGTFRHTPLAAQVAGRDVGRHLVEVTAFFCPA